MLLPALQRRPVRCDAVVVHRGIRNTTTGTVVGCSGANVGDDGGLVAVKRAGCGVVVTCAAAAPAVVAAAAAAAAPAAWRLLLRLLLQSFAGAAIHRRPLKRRLSNRVGSRPKNVVFGVVIVVVGGGGAVVVVIIVVYVVVLLLCVLPSRLHHGSFLILHLWRPASPSGRPAESLVRVDERGELRLPLPPPPLLLLLLLLLLLPSPR
jgi:hypothetical protein